MTEFRLPCEAWFRDEETTTTPLRGAGLSGSHVFLVQRPSGDRFVLKSFAPHVTSERATWVHALMTHLTAAGLDTVPRLKPALVATAPNIACETLVADQSGRLWELVAFVPGGPRPAPSSGEAATALAALAQLHAAAATLPGAAPGCEPSAGIRTRVTQAARMQSAPWRILEPDARRIAPPAVASRLLEAIDVFESYGGPDANRRIAAVEPVVVAVQPVLRDVWSDHVLFLDDGRLAGFIDFHAAGRDTPATDLSRLLGSWDASPATSEATWLHTWRHALDAYEAVRPLESRERRLIPWLHATGVICGLDNWFRWLITERREFADSSSVQARIARLVGELPEAVEIARNTAPRRD